jgi:hypothetical protein
MADFTTLEGKDSPGKFASLCRKALRPHDAPDVPQVAALCVYQGIARLRPADGRRAFLPSRRLGEQLRAGSRQRQSRRLARTFE